VAWGNILSSGSLMTELDQAINAAKKALENVLEKLRKDGLDSQVGYQLRYIFNALGIAVEGAAMAFYGQMDSDPSGALAAPAESPGVSPRKPGSQGSSEGSGGRFGKWVSERTGRAKGMEGTGKIKNGGWSPGAMGAAAYPARHPEPLSSSTPSPAERTREAVKKALAQVETAFDTRMPLPEPVRLPWYEEDGLREIIQRLFGARGEESMTSAWSIIDQMREMLAGQGVEVLVYDTGVGPEEQADAFSIEDRADGRNFRYETDIPALAVRASGGGRRIVGRGRALRVPVTDGAPEAAAEEGR
jgi:hypothetical protein